MGLFECTEQAWLDESKSLSFYFPDISLVESIFSFQSLFVMYASCFIIILHLSYMFNRVLNIIGCYLRDGCIILLWSIISAFFYTILTHLLLFYLHLLFSALYLPWPLTSSHSSHIPHSPTPTLSLSFPPLSSHSLLPFPFSPISSFSFLFLHRFCLLFLHLLFCDVNFYQTSNSKTKTRRRDPYSTHAVPTATSSLPLRWRNCARNSPILAL